MELSLKNEDVSTPLDSCDKVSMHHDDENEMNIASSDYACVSCSDDDDLRFVVSAQLHPDH